MKINRHNCEAWFLDYYEGQLTTDQVAELFTFLDAHPDLKELFESYGGPAFSADDLELPNFSQKESLRRVPELPAGINEVNYEEYFTAAIENTLDIQGQADLELFLSAHPAKRAELELFRKTILTPDYAESFGDKSALKKIVVSAETFDSYAAAALEGTLNSEEKTAFDQFLQTHPSFHKEFALFEKTVLEPDTSIVFENKEALRKTTIEITKENFGDYAIAALEGQLTGEALAAFNLFVSQNTDFAAEFELFEQTILSPDETILFEEKSALKKSVTTIDLNNYQEYAVAALDGELNAEDKLAFEQFVAQHPELQAELKLYSQTILTADTSIVFEHKQALRKAVIDVNAENFAQYAVALLDGELNSLEAAAIASFAAQHPHYAAELDAYQQTIIAPDLTETYPNKEALKRKAGGVFWLGSNVRYAAAAAVLLFVVTFWWMRGGDATGNSDSMVATTTWERDRTNDTAPNNSQQTENIANENTTANPSNEQRVAPRQSTPAPEQRTNGIQFASLNSRNVNGVNSNHKAPTIPNQRIQLLAENSASTQVASNNSPGINWGEEPKKTISATQYVMREAKALLEGKPKADDYAVAYGSSKNAEVSGKDLAGSAFNRTSRALGLNLKLNKSKLDGTSLEIGKYSFKLSQGDKTAE